MSTPNEPQAFRELAVTRRVVSAPPAQTLDDAVRLCDPFTPLNPREDAALHEDLSGIRGGDRLAKIVRNIRRSGGIPTLHFLSGHLGGGKTTELLRMKERLETAAGSMPAATVLFLDADTMLNRTDVELEDILVALWGLLYTQAPQAAAKVLGPLWEKQIRAALGTTVINLPDKVPDAIGKVLGEVRLPGVDQRHKVRSALGSAMPALIEGLNKAFDASVDRSAASVQADFERALPEAYVPVLRKIAAADRFPDDCKDDIKRDLLLNLFVLEYQNGDLDPWYAVHPLVERCRKFREHA